METNKLTKIEWENLVQVVKEKEGHVESWRDELVSLKALSDSNISFVTVQLYDHYTRDHIHGDNSLVGWVFVVLTDAIVCHEVYEGEAGGYRSFDYPNTLLVVRKPEPLNDKLYQLINSEVDYDCINGAKNENDNETIRLILNQLFPSKVN